MFCTFSSTSGRNNPDLRFLVFLDFPAFLLFEEFLAFLSVFPFFSKDFRGSEETENPCIFGGFPCIFPKKQGKEDQGRERTHNEKCFCFYCCSSSALGWGCPSTSGSQANGTKWCLFHGQNGTYVTHTQGGIRPPLTSVHFAPLCSSVRFVPPLAPLVLQGMSQQNRLPESTATWKTLALFLFNGRAWSPVGISRFWSHIVPSKFWASPCILRALKGDGPNPDSQSRPILLEIPVIPFLSLFLGKTARKTSKNTRIFPAEPQKPLEKKGKTLKKRKSSQGKKARNSKNSRKGRTGFRVRVHRKPYNPQ